jgi:hypothetical protein
MSASVSESYDPPPLGKAIKRRAFEIKLKALMIWFAV